MDVEGVIDVERAATAEVYTQTSFQLVGIVAGFFVEAAKGKGIVGLDAVGNHIAFVAIGVGDVFGGLPAVAAAVIRETVTEPAVGVVGDGEFVSGAVVELVGIVCPTVVAADWSGRPVAPRVRGVVIVEEGAAAVLPLGARGAVVAVLLIPVGVGSKIGRERVALVDGVAEVAAEIGVDGVVLVAGGVALAANGVFVIVQHGGAALAVRIPGAVAGVGVDVEVELFVGIDVGDPGRDAWTCGGLEAYAEKFVAFQCVVGDDIHHWRTAAIAGAGIGDDLDFLDAAGRQGADVLLEAFAVHVAGFVVNPHLHALGAPEGDVAVGVHLNAGCILQGVAGSAGLHTGVFLGGVDVFLTVHGVEGALGHNLHLLEGLAGAQGDGAEVHIAPDSGHLRPALIAHHGDHHEVLAGGHVFDFETATHVGGGATHKEGVTLAIESRIDKGHLFAALAVGDNTLHSVVLGHGVYTQKQKK